MQMFEKLRLSPYTSKTLSMSTAGAKRKRSGGIRQRLAEVQRDEAAETYGNESVLAKFLLELFAWGEMSPQLLQRICSLACEDFERANKNPQVLADLSMLARIGSNGTHKNKRHADLMAKVEPVSHIPKPFKVIIPFKDPLGNSPQGILLPHEMFSALYHNYPETWRRSLVPNERALPKFWNNVAGHPLMRGHPIKEDANFASCTVPIAIHGDGVPITGIGKGWSRIMTLFRWYSLVGQGSTRELLFWIWGMYDRLILGCVNEGTRAKFFQVLCWSLKALMAGEWPHRDHDGNVQLDLERSYFGTFV